jgi:hypothetical protein
MAQLVKLEPGDILVLANVGGDVFGDDETLHTFRETLHHLGVENVLVFEGDVDLSKVVGLERKVESFVRLYLDRRMTPKEAVHLLSDVPGDGG